MTVFTGTSADEEISPTLVSATVTPNDVLPGTGADVLYGGEGNDTLHGGRGADSQYGGTGNDLIYAVLGIDYADGGDDIDTLNTTEFTGNYRVDLASGLTNYVGEAFINFENLIAGIGFDTLFGSAGANLINGGDGNDILDGRGGLDTLLGGAGNDLVHVAAGIAMADGGSDTDTLNTQAITGNYTVNLATGVTSNVGESLINFENLIAGSGNDSLTGTSGSNRIEGGEGNDTLVGAGGDDSLYGGNGKDLILVSTGVDFADGGDGVDTLNVAAMTGSVTMNLETGLSNTLGESLINFENLVAGAGNDSLTGTNGANRIEGAAGKDQIFGLDGADTLIGGGATDKLFGGAGNDRLTGGRGKDTMVGGIGDDTFVFLAGDQLTGTKADIIQSGDGAPAFDGAGAAAGDRIDLAGLDADLTLAGNQVFTFGGIGKGQISLVTVGTDTVIRGNMDDDAAFELEIIIKDGANLSTAYTADDFIL